MTDIDNNLPETKRTRGKAKRRNFSDEMKELRAKVNMAVQLLKHVPNDGVDARLVTVAIEVLEGD